MYLTRMKIDTTRRETMKALISPNHFHGAIESSFSGEREHPLWRIDHLNDGYYLLVLSDREPDLTNAAEQFGFTGMEWEMRNYSLLLERIVSKSRWHFRLVANPVRSCPVGTADENGHSPRGKIQAHTTPAHQKEWLLQRSQKNGFSLTEDDFEVVHSQWKKFKKRKDENRDVSLLSVTFEGTLIVTDPDLFRKALCHGIGRGKAYGLGMMTVVGCHD